MTKHITSMTHIPIFKQIGLNAILLTFFCLAFSCNDDDPVVNYDPFIDVEGNAYPIGKMCDGKIWMLKNLSVSTFRNGDSIPYVYHENWKDFNDDNPAHCTILDSVELESEYGQLYNWYAVSDPRGLAPEGWRIPTSAEWQALVDCNGGNDVAGDRLKEAGHTHWKSGTGNNQSGFTAFPAGRRISIPDEYLGEIAAFRTADPSEDCNSVNSDSYYFGMHYSGSEAYTNCGNNNVGASVRCVRDE
jgi:uncharacterized protein (TIGR02145 family)